MAKGPDRVRALAGAVIWGAFAFGLHAHLADPVEGRDRRALEGLRTYLARSHLRVRLRFPEEVEIGVGDPVYSSAPGGSLTLIGEVRGLVAGGETLRQTQAAPGDGVREVDCLLRAAGSWGPAADARARLISVPQTASWVLRTLLPPEKLALIAAEWNRTLLEHREEIFEVLSPVLREVLRDLEEVIAEDLPPALEARRGELAKAGQRLHQEIVKGEFEPLLQTELWPVIQARAKPTMDAIGAEVWKRLPLWSFTWRILFQSLPLTGDRVLKAEVDRFWQEETVPILREHAGDFLAILQDIIAESAANPRVAEAFRRSFDHLIRDRDLQHQLRLIFQEVILDNPHFHERMARRWESPEVARALEVLSSRLEPMVRRIGDLVLGTRGGGITPEFARVLRTQILEKDRRWILLESPQSGGLPAGGRAPLESGAVIPGEVERR
jgi:hypothetical protein